MLNKKTLWIVGTVAVLLLSNYSTYWATSKVSQVQVLEEKIDKYEKMLVQTPQVELSK